MTTLDVKWKYGIITFGWVEHWQEHAGFRPFAWRVREIARDAWVPLSVARAALRAYEKASGNETK